MPVTWAPRRRTDGTRSSGTARTTPQGQGQGQTQEDEDPFAEEAEDEEVEEEEPWCRDQGGCSVNLNLLFNPNSALASRRLRKSELQEV